MACHNKRGFMPCEYTSLESAETGVIGRRPVHQSRNNEICHGMPVMQKFISFLHQFIQHRPVIIHEAFRHGIMSRIRVIDLTHGILIQRVNDRVGVGHQDG